MRNQAGMTLIEVLLAIALTALLAVLLGSLVNLWLDARGRLAARESTNARVLDLCGLLERRLGGLVLRPLQEHRLPLHNALLDWRPAEHRLDWVALDSLPLSAGQGAGRLRRQRLEWDAAQERLRLWRSAELDAVEAPVWQPVFDQPGVERLQLEFHGGGRWLAYPPPAEPTNGVRLTFTLQGAGYVCTFALPQTG
ncbi:prepilin-type N-terminal cleavage/methylation domain-containing protein [Pseudomonas oryzihabitans]|uniref:prepilin-type N-terminal cleavage/methylation domain-containing protein n=1 Tax=Pseudomonas oryzihabitans TaxID=47885 RepID=UPI0015E3B41F|nr:prepilin-type N-terminal cleavage/methylation domain-containing protein [Pseudomonas psychrotolerans]MBA1259575.1 prepilin-type N-terminal cleavage/methylation domain-containing protein [Pseudomonas psychrotolerans]